MAGASARTQQIVTGREILFAPEKVAGSGNYVPYGCISDADIDNPGTSLDTVACRAGQYKVSGGVAEPPTVKLSTIRRIPATADLPNNFIDSDVTQLVNSGAVVNAKLIFGSFLGDEVWTGPGIFNQQNIKGGQTGAATGGVTFNFIQMPVISYVQ